MMPILVKNDDDRSGRKAKVRHGRLRGRHRSQWVKASNFCNHIVNVSILAPMNVENCTHSAAKRDFQSLHAAKAKFSRPGHWWTQGMSVKRSTYVHPFIPDKT